MRVFILFIFSFLAFTAFSQEEQVSRCLTNGPAPALNNSSNSAGFRIASGNYNSVDGVIKIPVVVHVIHNNPDGTIGGANNRNISEEQILSQIEILNQDYRRMVDTPGFNDEDIGADMEIEFCLASIDPFGNSTNGIVRIYDPAELFYYRDDEYIKSLSHWPASEYLNIYTARIVQNDEQKVLGWGQLPPAEGVNGLHATADLSSDGVVIHYEAFGNIGTVRKPYDMGRSATHEVGHWLGLYHLWGEYGCESDYVSDTPLDAGGNFSPSCLDSSDCNFDKVYTMDMAKNFMDYSPDLCLNIFTLGQKERVRSVFTNSAVRNAIISSPACSNITGFETETYSKTVISPNPVNDILNLSFRQSFSGEITVQNQYGQTLGQYSLSGAGAFTIDLSSYHGGLYFIVLSGPDYKEIKKILKN